MSASLQHVWREIQPYFEVSYILGLPQDKSRAVTDHFDHLCTHRVLYLEINMA